jgi:3-oxoacyl-[acyl-carrier protein] reductase
LIKNLNIIITGTSSGIGLKLAEKFLKSENKVWGCSRRQSALDHQNYFHSQVDLSDVKQIENWISKVEEQTQKKIDIFISNASIFQRKLNSLDSHSSIIKTIKVNLISSMLLTNMISKPMIQNKKGLIVFFSSVASVVNEIGSTSYAASKSGLETFSQIIQKELEKFKIKVATFRILYVPTSLSADLNDKEINLLKNKFKSNKFGSTDEIFKEINNLYIQKNIPSKSLFYDELKNEK